MKLPVTKRVTWRSSLSRRSRSSVVPSALEPPSKVRAIRGPASGTRWRSGRRIAGSRWGWEDGDGLGQFLRIGEDSHLKGMRDTQDIQMCGQTVTDHVVFQELSQSGLLYIGQVLVSALGRKTEKRRRLLNRLYEFILLDIKFFGYWRQNFTTHIIVFDSFCRLFTDFPARAVRIGRDKNDRHIDILSVCRLHFLIIQPVGNMA